ncbi:MAG: hypothetical protein ACJA08_002111 [Cyclobacteriaceae bacterium]|jgi:hypothetical protein
MLPVAPLVTPAGTAALLLELIADLPVLDLTHEPVQDHQILTQEEVLIVRLQATIMQRTDVVLLTLALPHQELAPEHIVVVAHPAAGHLHIQHPNLQDPQVVGLEVAPEEAILEEVEVLVVAHQEEVEAQVAAAHQAAVEVHLVVAEVVDN